MNSSLNRSPFIQSLLLVYLLNSCITLMPFYFGGINALFICINTLIILLLAWLEPVRTYFTPSKTAIGILIIMSVVFLVYSPLQRISSLLYSFFFMLSFLFVVSNYQHHFSTALFLRVIRLIIQLYFIVLLVQQACAFLGLPIINTNPLFTDAYKEALLFFRHNSLSSEPSYGATMIVFLSYLYYRFVGFRRADIRRFWFPAMYSWFFFDSTMATLLGIMVIFFIMVRRRWYLSIVVLPLVLILISNTSSFDRIMNLFRGVEVGAIEDTIMMVDLSAAYRIIPTFLYINSADITSLSFWIGSGTDHAAANIVLPAMGEAGFLGGLMPAMLMDYGVICFLLLVIFIYRYAAVFNKGIFSLMLVFIIVNSNFNTQFFWSFLLFFAIARMIHRREYQNYQPLVYAGI